VFFDEKYARIRLFNASSSLLQYGPFDIIANNRSPVPFFSISTRQSNSFPESTKQSIYGSIGPHSILTETTTSPYRPSEVNVISLSPCLPRWAAKTIEAAGFDVGDISSGR
jgi:hypothetical protein